MSIRMRKRSEESGQALIIAVLVMLIVAVLAALFLAVIASQLRQAQRQSLTVALQEIAEAGLRYADHNLVHSAEGADWRPDPNPGIFDYGEGEFVLTVTYQPEAGDPYSRFIKLESLAKLKDNPFLQRRMVAYKPILLTDYIRFVTNGEKSPLPASLGASVRMYLYEEPPDIWPGRLYKAVFDGAIRINTDLVWDGDVQANLSSSRSDSIAVAGDITHNAVARWNPTSQQWDGDSSQVLVSINGGVPYGVFDSGDPAFTTLGGYYRDDRQQQDIDGNPRWVRYLDPPAIDRERYLALTWDSGTWLDGAGVDYAGQQVNTGWFGYGKGIYINNPEHIKYEHDYEKMRSEWVAVSGSYTPDAVVINISPGGPGGAPPPSLQLTWRGAGAGFRNRQGDLIGTSLELPFPRNGVIFAEGDVAVQGTLPPRIGSPRHYYDEDANRNYDLTIVSGGNVFIEQSILGPVSAGLPGADGDTDTKIALLARDSVVFNTPQLEQILQPTAQYTPAGVPYFEIRPGERLDMEVRSASLDPVQIYLKHTGEWNSDLAEGRADAAIMQVLINEVPYEWNIGGLDVYDGSTRYFLFQPPPVASYNNETNAVFPVEESIPNVDFGANKLITFTPTAINEPQLVTFRVTADSRRFYLVRDIKARVDVEIDAAMYAEHGSWFVIPGDFLNPPPGDPLGEPAPGEPRDIRITVLGAIAENRTAPLADVMDWTAKWRGSNASWLPTGPFYDDKLGISGFTLRYLYDMSLRRALVGEPGSPPRLPKLPVSPAMIAWGERI